MKRIFLLVSLFFTICLAIDAQDDVTETNTSPELSTYQAPAVATNTPQVFSTSKCSVCGKRHSPKCSPPPPPIHAPIDGGISLLLAAGAGYGVKYYRAKKSRK